MQPRLKLLNGLMVGQHWWILIKRHANKCRERMRERRREKENNKYMSNDKIIGATAKRCHVLEMHWKDYLYEYLTLYRINIRENILISL